MNTPLKIFRYFQIPYGEALTVQRDLQRALIEERGEDTLLLCEHPPVITLGRGAKQENLLVSKDQLSERSIELHEIERGGDITYHGPGQLVAYPIIDLAKKRRDVGWYMRQLEEVVLRTLAEYGIEGTRIQGKTGIWILPSTKELPLKKIASQGVRISRWKTLHGVSLNVFSCKEGFALIHPCGFADIEVTSIAEEQPTLTPRSVAHTGEILLKHFCEVFSYEHG